MTHRMTLAEQVAHDPPPARFDVDETDQAAEAWNFSCGPGAVCGLLEMTPEELRPHLFDFEQKGYTNPTLMFDVLRKLERMGIVGSWRGSPLVSSRESEAAHVAALRLVQDSVGGAVDVARRAHCREVSKNALGCVVEGSASATDDDLRHQRHVRRWVDPFGGVVRKARAVALERVPAQGDGRMVDHARDHCRALRYGAPIMKDISTHVWLILIMVSGAVTYIVADKDKYPKLAELGRICFWVALLVHLARLAKLY